jgi:hypothetical protein
MSDETKEEIQSLRRALVRLCWNLVADQAECECDYEGDEITSMCSPCEAFRALGLGVWPAETILDEPGHRRAAKILAKVDP